MNSFDERKKGFEKKFVRDEELRFKLSAKRNKYLGEWAAVKLGKAEDKKQSYILEVIKADMEEAGDEDVFRKIKKDFENSGININDSEIRNQMTLALERAEKDFK